MLGVLLPTEKLIICVFQYNQFVQLNWTKNNFNFTRYIKFSNTVWAIKTDTAVAFVTEAIP